MRSGTELEYRPSLPGQGEGENKGAKGASLPTETRKDHGCGGPGGYTGVLQCERRQPGSPEGLAHSPAHSPQEAGQPPERHGKKESRPTPSTHSHHSHSAQRQACGPLHAGPASPKRLPPRAPAAPGRAALHQDAAPAPRSCGLWRAPGTSAGPAEGGKTGRRRSGGPGCTFLRRESPSSRRRGYRTPGGCSKPAPPLPGSATLRLPSPLLSTSPPPHPTRRPSADPADPPRARGGPRHRLGGRRSRNRRIGGERPAAGKVP